VHFNHKNVTHLPLSHAKKIMKAIANLANVLKRKPLVTAQQEQEICNLTQLVEATSLQGTLPRVHEQNKNATALRVHPKATLQRVQESTPGKITQHTQSKASSPTTADKPAAITQRQKLQAVSKQQPGMVKPTTLKTRAAIACNADLKAPLSSRTQSKTMGTANAIHKRFARMKNEVHRALAVMDRDTGKLLNYRQLLRHPKCKRAWSTLAANKFGQLAQGVGGQIKGTNTISFIHKHEVPKSRMKDVTYGQFECNKIPKKHEVNRTRFTVGGDKINYPGAVSTPTEEMLVA
jgi:hypothetical protein